MNHLFIGLGGTGGNIIKSFRKLYYQQFGDQVADGIGIDYLWVDSSPTSFKDKQPDWDFLGKSLALQPRNQFYIAKADLRSIVDNLNAYPKLKPWLGDRESWGEVLNGLSPDAAGGQKRRLGRFLLAMHIDEFIGKVNTLVSELQNKTGNSNITFHVMCGLAGGTGSGTIVDVLAQLRKHYPNIPDGNVKNRIIAYNYLPDANPPSGWNTGNYHANAYAALLELNAMSAGRWQPFDLVRGGTMSPDSLDFVFNGCYIFTDKNSDGYTVQIHKGLTDIIADFLYHKVVVARNINWDSLHRAENGENGDSAPELEYGEAARSVRFLSFGISRIEFPEERLHESLSFEYQKQALEQLRFNHWQDGHGFIDRAKADSSAEYVNSSKVQEKWQISNGHLLLEKPIIETPESGRWRAHDLTWMDLSTHYSSEAQKVDTTKWLTEIFRLLDHSYLEQYRRNGIKEFFEYADRDKKSYASHIINTIEQDLMEDWKMGERSLSDCSNILSALRDYLDSRLSKIANIQTKKEDATEIYFEQFKVLQEDWAETRYFSLVSSSREKDLQKATGYLRDYYTAKTYFRAYEYQKDLINELLAQLAELQSELDRSNQMILRATEEAKIAINVRETVENSDENIETLEDPELQAKVRQKLVLDKDIQAQQTSMVRQKIFNLLGTAPTFKRFNEHKEKIKKELLQYSFDSVKVIHNKYITQSNEKILGVSIIDKLYSKFGHNQQDLNSKAKKLIGQAGDFASITNTQKGKTFEGIIDTASANRGLMTTGVLMPMPEGQKEFVDNIQSAFTNGFQGKTLNFVKTVDSNNAISVLSVTNLMPLRYIQIVSSLKDKYEQRIAHDPERATLEIHTEGDGSQLPNLFIMEEGQMKTMLRPLLILAVSTELIKKRLNTATQKEELIQERKDSDGFDLAPVIYGTDIVDVVSKVTDSQVMGIRQDLEVKLQSAIPFPQTEIDNLKEQKLFPLLDEIKQILITKHPRDAEKIILEWNDAAREVIKIIKGEVKL